MLKVLELFGGIGACTKALKRLHIDFQVVDYVEIDKNLLIEDELPSQKEIFEKTDSGQLKGQMNIFDFLRG